MYEWILCTLYYEESVQCSVFTLLDMNIICNLIWSFKIQWNESKFLFLFECEIKSRKTKKKRIFFVNEDFLSKAMGQNTNRYPNIIYKLIPNYDIERYIGLLFNYLNCCTQSVVNVNIYPLIIIDGSAFSTSFFVSCSVFMYKHWTLDCSHKASIFIFSYAQFMGK